MKKLTNSDSKIAFHPLPEDDPKRRSPDISKANRLLNWQPEVTLKEGLDKTIEWFKLKLKPKNRFDEGMKTTYALEDV